MKKKRFVALSLIAVMLFTTAACSGGSDDTTNTSGEATDTVEAAGETIGAQMDSITLQVSADPGTMAPWGTSVAAHRRARAMCYEFLYDTRSSSEAVPQLATSYEFTDDTHVRVKIREGVIDHAGNPLTASDVLWSYQQAAEASAYTTLVKAIDVENSTVEDEYTVLFALNYPYRYIEISPFTLVPIVTQASFEADPDGMINQPVGTGPYKMTSWVAGNELVFEKFDEYWGEGTEYQYQNVDQIVLKVVGEATQRTIELETGNVDLLYDIPTTDIQYLQDSEDYEVFVIPSTAVNTLQFNCSEYSACQDVRVRQAIAYAMDNQAIINTVYGGFGETLHCHVPSSADEYNPEYDSYEYYAYNVEQAKALMAEAGYANGLDLTIITDETAAFISAAQILQSYLKEIGINLTITQYESAVYQSTWGAHDGGWDMYFRKITASNCVQSPIGLLDYVNTPAATLHNEELQSLIETIQSDYGDVSALQDQIVEIMVEELPYYSFMSEPYLFAARAGLIETLTVDMMGSLHPGDWTYIQQ